MAAVLSGLPGTQFTCFTGTKVQILTREELRGRRAGVAVAGLLLDS